MVYWTISNSWLDWSDTILVENWLEIDQNTEDMSTFDSGPLTSITRITGGAGKKVNIGRKMDLDRGYTLRIRTKNGHKFHEYIVNEYKLQ